MSDTPRQPVIRYYFVDEAGDPMLFNRKKQTIVGNTGSSSFFILGKVDIENPTTVAAELESLRQRLLADPYFKGVPSMQPEQKKTAVAFHAKDDLPEVRREVFKWLADQAIRFYAVVRDKKVIADIVTEHNRKNPVYRYHPNQLYDRCVSQLFRERLHKHDGYKIYFAKRGSSDRTEALRKALEAARTSFYKKWGIAGTAPIEIVPANSSDVVCLQAADYCLWALQRFYERGEDRFLNLLASNVALIHDVDDTRKSGAGAFYTRANPLTLDSRAKK
jgi:Protein of unknown function (DUF3800)